MSSLDTNTKSERPIYFDYQTTAPLDPRVRAAMDRYLDWDLGDPASEHVLGRSAAYALDLARARIANLIGAEFGSRIVFSSGSCESLALATAHTARLLPGARDHVISAMTTRLLESAPCGPRATPDVTVTALPVDHNGRVDASKLAEAITERTFMVSIPLVQGDLGTVQDIAEVVRLAHDHGLYVHVDASRGLGHVPFDVVAMSVDLASLEAHRLCGPKGIGALYVSRQLVNAGWGGDALWSASITSAVSSIVGFGVAAEILAKEGRAEADRLDALADQLEQALRAAGVAVRRFGAGASRAPGYINLWMPQLDSEAMKELCATVAFSHRSIDVRDRDIAPDLVAMDVPEAAAGSIARIGLGRFTSERDIDSFVRLVRNAVVAAAQRQRAPVAATVLVNCEGKQVAAAGRGYTQFCSITNTRKFLDDLGEHTLDSLCAPTPPPRVNIVIPSYGSNDKLGETITSLLAQEVAFPAKILVLINEPPDAREDIRAANDDTETWLKNVIAGKPDVPARFARCDREVRAALGARANAFALRVVRHVVKGGIPVVYQTALSSFIQCVRACCENLGGDRARKLRALDELCDRTLLLFCDDDIKLQHRDALDRAYYDAVVHDCVILGRWRGLESATVGETTDPLQRCTRSLMSCFLDIKYDLGVNALPPKGLLLRHALEAGAVTLTDGFGDQLYFAQLASTRRRHMLDVISSIEEADYASNGRMMRDLRLYLSGVNNAALGIFHNLLRLHAEHARDARYRLDDIRQLITTIESRDVTRIMQYVEGLEQRTGGLGGRSG